MHASDSDSGPGGTGLVVVGYDGSIQADAAVEWAAAEAWRRGDKLLVSSVSDTSRNAGAAPDPQGWPSTELQAARHVAEQGAARARKGHRDLETVISTPFRHPAEALIEQSRGTGMLVVGASGHGNLTGAVFGSVAFAVIGHADCPVVVVRGNSGTRPGPDGPVVVGIDGSGSSQEAIDFAGRTASRSGATLTLVHAWHRAPAGGFASAYWAEVEPPVEHNVHDGQELLRAACADVLERYPHLNVRTRLVQGHPVAVLPAAAAGAALLVVGARGRGGFAGLMLGSVSRGLASTAPCPVAVVRGRTPRSAG